ncbi:MAG: hypothetical protein ACTSUE_16700 [Promethearchaeota archaeon]
MKKKGKINVSFNSVETSRQGGPKSKKKGGKKESGDDKDDEDDGDLMDIDSEFGPIVDQMRTTYGCGIDDVLSIDIFDLKSFDRRGAVVSFTSDKNNTYDAAFPNFNVVTQQINPNSCVATIICEDSYLKERIRARKRKRNRNTDTSRRGAQKFQKKSKITTQGRVLKKERSFPPTPIHKDRFETLKTVKGLTYVLGCWVFKCCVNYFKFKNENHKSLVIQKMDGKVNIWNEYRVKLRVLKKSPKKSYNLLFASDHDLLAHIIDYVGNNHGGANDPIKLWFDQAMENPGTASPKGAFQTIQSEIIKHFIDLLKSLHEEYSEQIFELNEGLYLFGD